MQRVIIGQLIVFITYFSLNDLFKELNDIYQINKILVIFLLFNLCLVVFFLKNLILLLAAKDISKKNILSKKDGI